MNPILLFYKSVDKSALSDGMSIPVDYQRQFLSEVGLDVRPGQRKVTCVYIDGMGYNATIDNIGFNRQKYPNHKDLLQIRYSKNSQIALKLREKFVYTQHMIDSLKAETGSTKLSGFPEEKKEFIAIYSSPENGNLMFDCISNSEFVEEAQDLSRFGEITAESVLDGTDPTADICIKTKTCKIRKLSRTITSDLKIVYGYRCQICGEFIGEKYGSNLIHAHHIDYFAKSLNNNSNNILVVCPNHHGIIHDINPVFDRRRKLFVYPNGLEEGLKLNLHI